MWFMKPFFLCGYAALYRLGPALGPHHLISANKTVLAVVPLGAGRLKKNLHFIDGLSPTPVVTLSPAFDSTFMWYC